MYTKYDVLGFGGAADTNYFVQVMTIKNLSTISQPAFYVGYYADGDLSDGGQTDRCNYDTARKMGYIFNNTPGGLYLGISSITSSLATPTTMYAIENAATAIDSIGIYDDFTTAEKFKSLSSGAVITNAGYGNTPGQDVSFTIGSGPYSIAAGDSIKLAFAFMVGKDLQSLQDAADRARLNTADFLLVGNKPSLAGIKGISLMPNPAKDRVTVKATEAIASVTILDPAGKAVSYNAPKGHASEFSPQVSTLKPGMYTVLVKTASGTGSVKFVKE
jgi:hypothetical protein